MFGPVIAVVDALVIACGNEGRDVDPVGEAEHAHLLANDAFLDDDGCSGVPEHLPDHRVVHGQQRLFDVRRHDNALARGEAVHFDHQRGAPLVDVVGRLRGVIEYAVRGGGHARIAHDLLSERFAALDARRRARGGRRRAAPPGERRPPCPPPAAPPGQ